MELVAAGEVMSAGDTTKENDAQISQLISKNFEHLKTSTIQDPPITASISESFLKTSLSGNGTEDKCFHNITTDKIVVKVGNEGDEASSQGDAISDKNNKITNNKVRKQDTPQFAHTHSRQVSGHNYRSVLVN